MARTRKRTGKLSWQQRKRLAIGMYLNKRQTSSWETSHTVAIELLTESGLYLITEQSSTSNPIYIAVQ